MLSVILCWRSINIFYKNNAIFNQNYTQKLFIAFKMAYSWCFGLKGNLDFPDFLQKSVLTSTTGKMRITEW